MNVYTSEVEMLRAQCREWEKVCNSHLRLIKKLKKERAWVGLTAAERSELWWATDMSGKPEHDYGKAIEAKLKEKNT
jgi:hypothetical protein